MVPTIVPEYPWAVRRWRILQRAVGKRFYSMWLVWWWWFCAGRADLCVNWVHRERGGALWCRQAQATWCHSRSGYILGSSKIVKLDWDLIWYAFSLEYSQSLLCGYYGDRIFHWSVPHVQEVSVKVNGVMIANCNGSWRLHATSEESMRIM